MDGILELSHDDGHSISSGSSVDSILSCPSSTSIDSGGGRRITTQEDVMMRQIQAGLAKNQTSRFRGSPASPGLRASPMSRASPISYSMSPESSMKASMEHSNLSSSSMANGKVRDPSALVYFIAQQCHIDASALETSFRRRDVCGDTFVDMTCFETAQPMDSTEARRVLRRIRDYPHEAVNSRLLRDYQEAHIKCTSLASKLTDKIKALNQGSEGMLSKKSQERDKYKKLVADMEVTLEGELSRGDIMKQETKEVRRYYEQELERERKLRSTLSAAHAQQLSRYHKELQALQQDQNVEPSVGRQKGLELERSAALKEERAQHDMELDVLRRLLDGEKVRAHGKEVELEKKIQKLNETVGNLRAVVLAQETVIAAQAPKESLLTNKAEDVSEVIEREDDSDAGPRDGVDFSVVTQKQHEEVNQGRGSPSSFQQLESQLSAPSESVTALVRRRSSASFTGISVEVNRPDSPPAIPPKQVPHRRATMSSVTKQSPPNPPPLAISPTQSTGRSLPWDNVVKNAESQSPTKRRGTMAGVQEASAPTTPSPLLAHVTRSEKAKRRATMPNIVKQSSESQPSPLLSLMISPLKSSHDAHSPKTARPPTVADKVRGITMDARASYSSTGLGGVGGSPGASASKDQVRRSSSRLLRQRRIKAATSDYESDMASFLDRRRQSSQPKSTSLHPSLQPSNSMKETPKTETGLYRGWRLTYS